MNKIGLFNAFKGDTWVRPFFKKYRSLLILAILLGFLTFFCGGALMFNSGYLISRAASIPENILLIYVPIVLTRAFGIGRPVFRYIERLTSHNWVLRMTSQLRLKLYKSLESDAIFFKQRFKTGDILGLLAEDIDHIQNLYLRTIFPTIIAWTLYVFIIICLGLFSPLFGLAMLLMLGVVVFVLPLFSVLANGARQEQKKRMRNNLYQNLTDNVLGVSDWIFSQRGTDFVDHYEQSELELHQIDQQIQNYNRKSELFVQLSFGAITVALLIWSAFTFPGNHGGAANWIAAFVLTIFPLIDAFAPLPDAAEETNIYKDSIVRFNNLSDVEKVKAIQPVPSIKELMLSVKDVDFAYPDGTKKVLNDISFNIYPGEKLAILGKSGSGKSTLAHLLRGDLSPNTGSISLGGYSTDQLGDSISDYIGVIHQTPYLFNTTLLNNIRIGNENASEDEVWNVLDRVQLKETIQKLPQQLNTMVDEAGLRFSGGERHRIALARILLQDVPIVLLDEPTVGLDPITEQELLNTFFNQLNNKTVIWITHHLQGVSITDKVIFIEDGKIAMNGSPAFLARDNKYYQQLMKIDGLN
ncbi:thiol reductant ABC exporter subunit CydC [Pediococcus claussenii]|uniref:thiol reductant ABC exporter subunit CydC n=1 Tax=Pediococcus claussenii TaxID=187452 RepID=UPI0005A076D8|nr:thiol reductant ABC exporter subunit CydC [Pediococcus claussenii]